MTFRVTSTNVDDSILIECTECGWEGQAEDKWHPTLDKLVSLSKEHVHEIDRVDLEQGLLVLGLDVRAYTFGPVELALRAVEDGLKARAELDALFIERAKKFL